MTKGENNTVTASDESSPRGSKISSSRKRRLLDHAPYVLIILLVALAIRIVPYTEAAFFNGQAVVIDPDACYHLRRAELFRHHFPELPIFDTYLNHPHGAYPIWPPLYDLVLAGLWSLFGLIGLPSPLAGLLYLPPVLMAIACVLIYRIGLRLWPGRKWFACGAALLPALLPLTVSYSYLGNLDHHAAEMLAVVLFVNAFTAGLTVLPGNRSIRHVLSIGWWPGLFLGLGLLVEHGLVMLEPFILLSLLLLQFKWKTPSLWLFGGVINAVACLIILPFGLYGSLQGVPFIHSHFSLFHPMMMLGAALFYLTIWLILLPPDRLKRAYRFCAVGIGAILVLILAAVQFREVLAGASHLTGTASGWLAQIGETTSVLKIPLNRSVTLLGSEVSLLVFLLPVFWWLFHRQRHHLSASHWILLSSSIVFAGIGLQQIRFMPYFALIVGLVAVFVIEILVRRLPSALQILALAAVLALGYLPCSGKIGSKDLLSTTGFKDIYPMLQWLREESPPTSHYLQPDQTAEYGVLAEWSLGHYIKYYSHRPVLADNFGEHAADLSRLNHFFFAHDNDQAYAFLDENRVRYILCRDLPTMYQTLFLDRTMLEYVSDLDKSTGRIIFDPKIYPTVLCRLVWRYGGAFIDMENGLYYPPLDRLRLVAESQKRDETMRVPELARMKLYEYVPGARLLVTGTPSGTELVLSTKIITPHGRTFPYIQLVASDSNGTLHTTLPYPNEKTQGAYAKEYSLMHGDDQRTLPPVTEKMVREGSTVKTVWE